MVRNLQALYGTVLLVHSGSTVDKVIVAQGSLQRFIDDLSPGAYESITKVDFKILDRLSIKPLGIYGSKFEIVRLLQSIGAVDEKLCVWGFFPRILFAQIAPQGSLIARTE